MNKIRKNEKTEVYVIPFSHLDLFWAGTREECLSRGNYIIRQALDLLEKHDNFRFLIETVNFIDHYLNCFPEEQTRIRKFLKTGKLELSSLWTGIYLNLPSGETIVRNILYAKKFAEVKLDYKPLTAHFGDLPGYTPQIPQLAVQSKIKNAVICRSGPQGYSLFKWRGLDGSSILAYYAKRGYHAYTFEWHDDYTTMTKGPLEARLEEDAADGEYPFLIHWGSDLYAPNERVVYNVEKWNADKQFILKFASLREYFSQVETGNFPVLEGEIPSCWPNVESSWPDLWPEDIPCEAALHMAEFLSVFCLYYGWNGYPEVELEAAWKSLLDGMDHNQNGQGGVPADRDKLQLRNYSLLAAEKIIREKTWKIAANIKASCNNLASLVVFNSMSWRRSGLVKGRLALFGEVAPASISAYNDKFKLVDSEGRTIPYVPLRIYKGISATLEIAFYAADIPATGYRTYYVVPGENPFKSPKTCQITADNDTAADPRRNMGSDVYENKFYRFSVDTVTGDVSIFCLRQQEMLFDKINICGVEERRGNYIFNMTPSGRVFPAQISRIETLDNNAVWCRFCIHGDIYGMPFMQEYTLFNASGDILIENEICWNEPHWIRIQQVFRYAGDNAEIRYGVPYGHVKYPEVMENTTETEGITDELDIETRRNLRLCRNWVDIGGENSGATIAGDHRMWEFSGHTLRSYMIRGAGFCHAVKSELDGKFENISRPPAGKYKFRYMIRPRHRIFEKSLSHRCGWELNYPVLATCVNSNRGEILPDSTGLVDFSGSSVIVSAIKKAETGNNIVLRGFETSGQTTAAELPGLDKYVCYETDILERNLKECSSNKLTFHPFEVKSVIFKQAKER